MSIAVIIVDHGSRSGAANALLEEVVRLFADVHAHRYAIVEPAHMELAEPSIADAYARCVQRGATHVVVCPFFLAPGKHMQEDIPRLAAQAAARFPKTTHQVAAPLGCDGLMVRLLGKRVEAALTSGGLSVETAGANEAL